MPTSEPGRNQAAARYGDRHASVYDRIYGARFVPDTAVAALVQAAGEGRVLELGVGTGRLAIPLTNRGVPVDGIEASASMVAQLRAQPGGEKVYLFEVDLDDFELPRRGYAVAVCAVSTLFMLPSRQAQSRCLASAARHLRPGGRLFVETFRPDPSRFDTDGRRTEQRPTTDGSTHEVRSVHDSAAQTIRITHLLGTGTGTGTEAYEVTLTYATQGELDVMAAEAGLQLVGRWDDWAGAAAVESSTDPVSVYRR